MSWPKNSIGSPLIIDGQKVIAVWNGNKHPYTVNSMYGAPTRAEWNGDKVCIYTDKGKCVITDTSSVKVV